MQTKYIDNFSAGHSSVYDASLIQPGAGPVVENLNLDSLKLQSEKDRVLDEIVGGYLVPYWFRGNLIKRRFDNYTPAVFDTNKLYYTENNKAKFDFHASDGTVTTHDLILENPSSFCVKSIKHETVKCSSGLEEQIANILLDGQISTTTTPIIKYAALLDHRKFELIKARLNGDQIDLYTLEPGKETRVELYIDNTLVMSDNVIYGRECDAHLDDSNDATTAAYHEGCEAMFYHEHTCSPLATGSHTCYVVVTSEILTYTTPTHEFTITDDAVDYYDLSTENTKESERLLHVDGEPIAGTLPPLEIPLPLAPVDYSSIKVTVGGKSVPYTTSAHGALVEISVLRAIHPFTAVENESKNAMLKIDVELKKANKFSSETTLEYYLILGTADGVTYTYFDEKADVSQSFGIASPWNKQPFSRKSAILGSGIAWYSEHPVGRYASGVATRPFSQLTDYTYVDFELYDTANTKGYKVFLYNRRLNASIGDFREISYGQVNLDFMSIADDLNYDIVLKNHSRQTTGTVWQGRTYVLDFRRTTSTLRTDDHYQYNTPSSILFEVTDAEVGVQAKITNLNSLTESAVQTAYDKLQDLKAHAGKLSYAVVVQNPVTTVMSVPTFVLEYTSYERQATLNIDDIPNGLDVLIYRRGAFQAEDTPNSVFQLVTKLEWDGNTTREYLDNISTPSLGKALTTKYALKSQDDYDFNLISIDKQHLFLAYENKLAFSTLGNFTLFEELNTISLSSDITGIIATTYGQVVFTASGSIYNIRFDRGQLPLVEQLAANIPLVSETTLAIVNDNVFFLSYEGIMLLRGTTVKNITKDSVNKEEFNFYTSSSSYSASVLYDKYYLAEIDDGSMWIVDLHNAGRVTKYTALAETKNIVVMKGELYETTSDATYKLFDGTELEFNFVSGNLVAPFYDMEKEFLELHIVYKGQINVVIYIDDTEINSVDLNSITLQSEKFYFKSSQNKGIQLKVKVQGIGQIKSLRTDFEELHNV